MERSHSGMQTSSGINLRYPEVHDEPQLFPLIPRIIELPVVHSSTQESPL